MRNRHKYPSEWYDTIRPNVLRRDKYKCTQCQIRHRQWVAVTKSKERIKIDQDEIHDYNYHDYNVYQNFLHVCHKDNNKDNCNDDNLVTLCVVCHAKLDSGYKAIMRKAKKRSTQVDLIDMINECSHPQSLASLAPSDIIK